jgi:ribosomal protein L12E/L44/L45/RPP1/RPP2
MTKKLTVFARAALCFMLLAGLLVTAGCGEQNVKTGTYETMKKEIKAEVLAELRSEIKTMPAADTSAAAPSPAPAAAAEEEEEEDQFGC